MYLFILFQLQYAAEQKRSRHASMPHFHYRGKPVTFRYQVQCLPSFFVASISQWRSFFLFLVCWNFLSWQRTELYHLFSRPLELVRQLFLLLTLQWFTLMHFQTLNHLCIALILPPLSLLQSTKWKARPVTSGVLRQPHVLKRWTVGSNIVLPLKMRDRNEDMIVWLYEWYM